MSLCHLALLAVIGPMRAGLGGVREALMICRQPSEAVCREIRAQLAVLTGRALRRGLLRHHVEHCEDCRAFAIEVRRQGVGLGILLSVVPSLALTHNVLTSVSAAAREDVDAVSATAAMAGGRVAAAGADGTVGSGETAADARSVAARVLLALALALAVAAGAPWRVLRRRAAGTRPPVPPRVAHGDAATQQAASGDVSRDDVRDPSRRNRPR